MRVLALLLPLACAPMRGAREADPVADELAAADALWALRAEPEGLARAVDAYARLLGQYGDDPRILARLSRAEWVRGLVASDPEHALSHHEAGREFGWRCLLGAPGFAGIVRELGVFLPDDALATVGADRVGCMAWLAGNGVAVVDLRGPGAALALEDLAGVVERARGLDPDAGDGILPWAAAQVILLDPATESTAAARALLQEAVAAAPGLLFFRVALAEAFPDERDRVLSGFEPPDGRWALENAAVARRVALPDG